MKDYDTNQIFGKIVEELNLQFFKGNAYTNEKTYWKKHENSDVIKLVYSLYNETEQSLVASTKVKEALKRVSNAPQFQIDFNEEEKLINLKNGIYDAEQGTLLERTDDRKFSYVLNFTYIERATLEMAPNFRGFVESTFPDETEKKTQLLLQTLGYGLSAYTRGKCGFFYIGKSNSGKSTFLEFLMKVLSEDVVSAIPLQRLSNRFNLARLHGKKVNICTEIAENSLDALDMFKTMVSNEVVTAEHKGKPPFEFRIKCKSFNAGNMLPAIDKLEGMDAIINRMIILFFPISIVKEEQDFQLLDKLFDERNVICSLALKELHELQKNNFVFVEPLDSYKVKEQMLAKSKAFDEFIDENFEFDSDGRVYTATLYDMFKKYCEVNFYDVKISKAQFLQKICAIQGVEKKKIRVNGGKPLNGIVGLKIKKILYDNLQDSEM